MVVKKSVEAYLRLFKTMPYVPDKGIENVLKIWQPGAPYRRNLSAVRNCSVTTHH